MAAFVRRSPNPADAAELRAYIDVLHRIQESLDAAAEDAT